jgi:hypothetical protein
MKEIYSKAEEADRLPDNIPVATVATVDFVNSYRDALNSAKRVAELLSNDLTAYTGPVTYKHNDLLSFWEHTFLRRMSRKMDKYMF